MYGDKAHRTLLADGWMWNGDTDYRKGNLLLRSNWLRERSDTQTEMRLRRMHRWDLWQTPATLPFARFANLQAAAAALVFLLPSKCEACGGDVTDATGCCVSCGLDHSEPCPACLRSGLHAPGCKGIES